MNRKSFQAIARAIGLAILLTLAQPMSARANACRELFGAAQVITLSPAAFEQLKAATKQILTKFPPAEYFYVGLGRSPTGVIALLQAAQIPAATLPLSMFRSHPLAKGFLNGTGFGRHANYADALTPNAQERLFRHFEKFLPDAATLTGKKILLIDYSETGKSLVGAGAYLQLYYQSRGLKQSVELASMKNTLKKPDPTMLDLPVITLQKDLTDAFANQAFDDWAQYGRYHPTLRPEVPKANPNYSGLIREFQRRLALSPMN